MDHSLRALNMIRCAILISLPVLALSTSGCTHRVNIAQPTAPPLVPPAVEDSTISTTASVNLTSVCSRLDTLIPSTISENPDHPCIQWGIYKSSPLKCAGSANTFDATLDLAYKAGEICSIGGIGQFSCGFDHPLHATLDSNALITWNPNWYADVAVTPNLTLDTSCTVSLGTDSVNALIQGKLQPQIGGLTAAISQQLTNATDVKNRINDLWTRLNEPIPAGTDAWVMVHPKAFEAANPSISNNTLILSASLSARPELIIAQSPPAVPVPIPELPPLGTGITSNSFHVALTGYLSWVDASSLLSSAVRGKTYSVGWFHKISIEDVKVLGTGNVIIVAVRVDGDVKGTIYFQGTPTFIQAREGGVSEAIEIPNLEFSLETRNILLKVANWILHSEIQGDLRSKAVLPLSTRISDLQGKLQAALNQPLNPKVSLKGTVQDVSVRGVYLVNGGITVQGVADGITSIEVIE